MEEKRQRTAAVVTLSDKGAAGQREDKSGPLICEMLRAEGYQVEESSLLPDDQGQIEAELIRLCDTVQVELIVTTGGTGFSTRDCTPEATLAVATRMAPGIAEMMRWRFFDITPRAMLGRGVSAIRNRTLIVNLPGSPKAARENLETVLPHLAHGLDILRGRDGECAR